MFSLLAIDKKKAYYRKVLIMLIVLSIGITLLMSFSISAAYYNSIIKQVSKISAEITSSKINHYESIYDQAVSLGLQLLNEEDVINYFYIKNVVDMMIEFKAIDYLNKRKIVYPFINSIVLYNSNLKLLTGEMAQEGNRTPDDEMLINNIESMINTGVSDLKILPRVLHDSVSGGDINIISLIIFDNSYTNKQNAVIINLLETAFHGSKESERHTGDNFTLMFDNTGRVILNEDENEFLKDYSGRSFVQQILRSKEQSGSIFENYGNGKYFISYAKSNLMKGTVISMISKDTLLKEPKAALKLFTLLVIIILILFIAVSWYISKYLYRPIKKMVEKFSRGNTVARGRDINEIEYITQIFDKITETSERLEIQNTENLDIFRNEFIKEMLETEIMPEQIKSRLKKYNLSIPENALRLIVFQYDEIEKIDMVFNSLIENETIQIIADMTLQEYPDILYCIMNKGRYSLIISSNNADTLDEIISLTTATQKKLNDIFNLSVSAAISNGGYNIEEINRAYIQCVGLLDYRLVYGANMCFYPELISNKINELFNYPDKLEKEISVAFKLNRKEDYVKSVEKLLEESSEWSVNDLINFIFKTMLSCYKYNKAMYGDHNRLISDYDEFSKTLKVIYGRENLYKWLMDMYDNYWKVAVQINESREKKNRKFIEDITRYIEDRYYEQDICIEKLSNMVNISTGYFSKIFKETTGRTFIDFLMEIRLENAKKYILEDQLSMSEISIKCGFNNENYFYRFFKKNTGITPSQFRTIFNQEIPEK